LIEQFARYAPAANPPAALADLMPRQAEVLRLGALGADALDNSPLLTTNWRIGGP